MTAKEETEGRFRTASGIPVRAVYRPADAPGPPAPPAGEFPFTRGIHPGMYRKRVWTMRQYAGFGTARETNLRFRYLLEQGQTGLSVAFDLPTQLGLDSDHPMARGEVGRAGVAIDTLADLETLFDGIPLDQVSVSMTINATAAILLAMFVAAARRQGVARDRLSGTVQNDILKEYLARGNYIYPPEPSLRLVTDTLAWCAENLPRWNSISVSGYHIREAGATAVQEVAFTFLNAIAYLEAARAAGLAPERFLERASFFFSADGDFLEEIAKFRCARRLWAGIVRDRFGVTRPAAQQLRFHVQTAGSSLTAQQPENNIVRSTLQALAAVLGGAQSLHVNAMDEALGLPTEHAATLALRTQQILAGESGVANTVDPVGGAWYLEALTDRIEADARDYIARVDGLGGAVAVIRSGYLAREIHESAYRRQRRLESGEDVVVGVNRYREEAGEAPVPVHRVPEDLESDQVARLRRHRERVDPGGARSALAEVEASARSNRNLLPGILAAVEAGATVGQAADALRRVFGEHRPTDVIG
ncbi:MAG: methylmalonyl-CoA mutase [Acidobacteria bacterium]|nr:methylmalonyl-CoA mutase [Acidobacteriota bacterium]